MKLIRKSRLRYTEEKTDIIYEIDLCETPGGSDDRFVVNFRWGRSGTNFQEGTRTNQPVALTKAQKIFDSIVVSKINNGYRETGNVAEGRGSVDAPGPPSPAPKGAVRQRILRYLSAPPGHWPLSRIIWRAGELKISEAADKIAGMTGQGDEQTDYAVAWALGRCGNEAHLPVIEAFLNHRSHAVRRMAHEAFVSIAPRDDVDRRLADIKAALPQSLRQCIDIDDVDTLSQRLIASLSDIT